MAHASDSRWIGAMLAMQDTIVKNKSISILELFNFLSGSVAEHHLPVDLLADMLAPLWQWLRVATLYTLPNIWALAQLLGLPQTTLVLVRARPRFTNLSPLLFNCLAGINQAFYTVGHSVVSEEFAKPLFSPSKGEDLAPLNMVVRQYVHRLVKQTLLRNAVDLRHFFEIKVGKEGDNEGDAVDAADDGDEPGETMDKEGDL